MMRAMLAIILEGVLFVALIATLGALLFWATQAVTPFGRVMRQTQNRRRLERAADLTCPIHGTQREHELVRLQDGDTVCARCYQETLHGRNDL